MNSSRRSMSMRKSRWQSVAVLSSLLAILVLTVPQDFASGALLKVATLSDSEAKNVCPVALQKMSSRFLGGVSFCSLHHRYVGLRTEWQERGVSERAPIVEVVARRFIGLQDWRSANRRGLFNPRFVYQPSPRSWDRWWAAAQYIEAEARQNWLDQEMAPLDLVFIQKLHFLALLGLYPNAGQWRMGGEIGAVIEQDQGLTDEQVFRLKQASMMAASGAEARTETAASELSVGWKSSLCLEDQPSEVRQRLNKAFAEGHPWFHEQDWPSPAFTSRVLPQPAQWGREHRQCGFILYPSLKQVLPLLQQWSRQLQEGTKGWYRGDFGKDPILIAARAQRQFIKIHPFLDGNGRTSRLIIDALIASLDLPVPVLDDMDVDLYSSDEEWAQKISEGMLNHLDILESCLSRPNIAICQPFNSQEPEPLKPSEE